MDKVLDKLGIKKVNEGAATGTKWLKAGGAKMEDYSPVDGKLIASVTTADRKAYDKVVDQAQAAFAAWRMWPAPKRGEAPSHQGAAPNFKGNETHDSQGHVSAGGRR